jgi:hypothetical protein
MLIPNRLDSHPASSAGPYHITSDGQIVEPLPSLAIKNQEIETGAADRYDGK